jgi:TonB-linked SusC/RagA family outer membrane protein
MWTAAVLTLSALGMALPLADVLEAQQQQAAVAGTVVAEGSRRPLAGAQVVVAGTTRGTTADASGRFRIPLDGVTGEFQLQVTMIGYRTATVTAAAGQLDLRIAMAESAIALDQIVVAGTAGGQQRRAIGNSVATLNAAEVTELAPIRSMQDLINGRAAGVVIMPGTGMVGSGSRIRIRGTSTFSLSGEPLLYVDGVRVNNETGSGLAVQGFGSGVVSRLNDFDPDQIESIEILKGPAAATLYGTEAARGVINIITKKGTTGAPRFSMRLRQGVNRFHDYENRLPVNYWRDPSGQIRSVNVAQRLADAGDPLFRSGHVQGYSLNVSGGTDGLRYFIGGDLNRDEGVEFTNQKDQMSLRSNIQLAPNEKVDLGLSLGYTTGETQLSCEAGCGGTMWTTVFSTPAHLPEYRCVTQPGFGCDFWEGTRSGPPARYHVRDLIQDIDRFTASLQMTYRPTSWLNARLTVGTDVTQETNVDLIPFLDDPSFRYFWGQTTANGFHFQSRRDQTFNTFDFVTSANVDLTESINLSSSVGIQYYNRHIEFLSARGEGFAAPGLTTINAAALTPGAGSDYLTNNTLGVYLQEVLSLNDRLFLTGAVRVDNNSAFGSELDFVTYPKASLSWVVSEEPAFEDRLPTFLSALKLRAAYGHSGTQPLALSALRTFAPVTGPGGTPAVTPSTLGNPELGPERGVEVEFGFDAGLLDERIGIEFTYYQTRTKDGILLRPIAPSTGYPGSRWENAGELLNTGFEALVRGNVLSTDNFGWDLTLSLATNNGKVERLAGGDTTIVTGNTQYRIGYAPNAFFRERVVSADWDPTTRRAVNALCDNGAGGTTACFNAAGQVIAPRVYLGRSTPGVEASLTSTFRILERLSVSALFDYKGNYRKADNNLRARCQVFRTCMENMNPEDYDPRVIAQMQTSGTLVDFVINDASFARLRELSVTYDLPRTLASQFGARTASVSLAGRNLHTWTNYTGLDPEATFLSGSPGFLEQSTLPQLMQWMAVFNVNF